jgi:hydrocephalus-inducing protein
LTFEGLPDDLEDELRFGDCIVNKTKTINFQMINTSENALRFNWTVE